MWALREKEISFALWRVFLVGLRSGQDFFDKFVSMRDVCLIIA